MRPHIPFLDTNKMEWDKTPAPGLFTKRLSTDGKSTARTALQRMDPALGFTPPQRCHWHHADEEILVVKGHFSFDSKVWLNARSYCFHPRETVHGFKSNVPQESWFLSRVTADLDFNFPDPPQQLSYYSATGKTPERGVAVVVDPSAEKWQPMCNKAGKIVARRLLLSADPRTGEGSALIRLLPGWKSERPKFTRSFYEENFFLEGEVIADDGTVFGAGCYCFKPPRTVHLRKQAEQEALVYVNFGGPLDAKPGARKRKTR